MAKGLSFRGMEKEAFRLMGAPSHAPADRGLRMSDVGRDALNGDLKVQRGFKRKLVNRPLKAPKAVKSAGKQRTVRHYGDKGYVPSNGIGVGY